VVIALRSNIRWCSDHLELACRNGDIVRVLFVMSMAPEISPLLAPENSPAGGLGDQP
jgi:hypothetical protein